MAAGTILTVLSNIPWGQVVENAPKVADAASRLWGSVTNRKKQGIDEEASIGAVEGVGDATSARVLALEESVRSLQEQMQASSELIKALAEQNTQLVERIEMNRARFVRFAIAMTSGCAVLLAAVVYLLLQP